MSPLPKLFGKRVDASLGVAASSTLPRRVDPRNSDRASHGLPANGHRFRPTVIPRPHLSASKPPVGHHFGIVCVLVNFILEALHPLNDPLAIAAVSQADTALHAPDLLHFRQLVETHSFNGDCRGLDPFRPLAGETCGSRRVAANAR